MAKPISNEPSAEPKSSAVAAIGARLARLAKTVPSQHPMRRELLQLSSEAMGLEGRAFRAEQQAAHAAEVVAHDLRRLVYRSEANKWWVLTDKALATAPGSELLAALMRPPLDPGRE